VEWADTPLGARSEWPAELDAAIRTVLASRLPVMLYWGEEFVQIYNDAFLPILGNKHPDAFGRPAAQCWPEVWQTLEPDLRSILAGRHSVLYERQLLFIDRHGYLERPIGPTRIHRSPTPVGGCWGYSARRRTPAPPKSSVSAGWGLCAIWATCPAPVPPTRRTRAG